MRKKVLALIFIILLGLSIKTLYSKNFVTKELENVVPIAKKEFKKLEYGKVIFKHQKHVEAIANIYAKPQEKVCVECHQEDKYGNYTFDFSVKNSKSNPEELKNAYHKNCLTCHQKLSAEGRRTGPEILSCRDCHKKEYEIIEVKYPVFEFDFELHDKHLKKHERDCSLCHHIYDIEEKNKELALVYERGKEQSCYYCHDLSRRRGPELTKIIEIAEQKDLDIKRAFHLLCINCHLQNRIKGRDAGPIVCSKCHTGKYKNVEELMNIPRPDVDQPNIAFIYIDQAKMKGVPFDHNFHEKKNKTCKDCHHETLKSCRECHSIEGKEDGRFVSITTSFHSLNSEISCQGCHRKQIDRRECMGCHYFIPPVKAELGKRQLCEKCHTGKKEEQPKIEKISTERYKIKEEVVIKHLEKDFKPVRMPHGKIIRKLTETSNQSKLATYFHGNIDTICRGCHHKSKENAEVKTGEPVLCISCHSAQFSLKDISRPRLQSAYHGMCIKCHETMGIEKPKKCTDCHERKVKD